MKQDKKDGSDISSAHINFLNAKTQKERLNCIQEIGQGIIKSQIKESQFPQIWKNLFDGLLLITKEKDQTETAQKISQLVTYFEFSDQKLLLKWIRDCFELFHKEWEKVDFELKSNVLYLMWFCYLEVLYFLQLRKFDTKLVKQWNQILVEVLLGTKLQKKATGMVLYTLEIFVLGLIELKKPSHDALVSLMDPFVEFLAVQNDKALSTRIIENIFHVFLKDIEDGHFSKFDKGKYIEYLRKRAGGKDVNENNQKLLNTVQKAFAEGVEPEEDSKAVTGKKRGRKSKAELAAETKKGKKGKAETKQAKKKAEKNKKNSGKEDEEGDEDEEEDDDFEEEEDDNDGRMEDEEEDENDFDEEEDPKPAKRKNSRKKEAEEEDELPEDWDEEEAEDEDVSDDEVGSEDDDDEQAEDAVNGLIEMSDNGRIPPYLLQTVKQQQIYFNRLNKEYYDNLKKAKKKAIEHKRKVNFQLKKNTVKEFNKKNKVDDKKKGDRYDSTNKSNSILKKQSFGENLIKSKKAKKGGKKKVKI